VPYSELHGAQSFNNLTPRGVVLGGASAASTAVKDQSNWLVSVRAHRDFLPRSSDRGMNSSIPGGPSAGDFSFCKIY
jgi:hypothetical protein